MLVARIKVKAIMPLSRSTITTYSPFAFSEISIHKKES